MLTEEDMIKQAMEQSLKESSKSSLSQLDEALIKTVMQMSQNDHIDKTQISEAVRLALDQGFSLE